MIKEIFTWWNGQTFGTRIWTIFSGHLIATDENQNKFYTNKNDTMRWVIYYGEVEATKVLPEWNNWLRYTSMEIPSDLTNKFNWQKKHSQNKTGTKNAYSPKSSKFTKKVSKEDLDYDKWEPNQ